jgi:hypothetical protein
MKSRTTSDERPRTKALRFVIPDLPDRPSLNVHMFTEDIQSRILIRRADSDGIFIRFEGAEEERTRANHVCALVGEDRHRSGDTIGAAIEQVVLHLAYRGRAVFELVRDSKGEIADIASFPSDGTWFLFGLCVQVPPRSTSRELETKYAVLRRADVWRVEMPHELGGYRGYRRLLARISTWPSLGPKFQEEDIKEGKWPKDFIIGDYMRAYEVQRYQVTRRWGWNGRDWSSQYVTEYYQFHRLLTFRWSIEVLRRHVIQELSRLFRRLGIAASIVLEGLPSPDEILLARDRMERGEIDFAEASKITAAAGSG